MGPASNTPTPQRTCSCSNVVGQVELLLIATMRLTALPRVLATLLLGIGTTGFAETSANAEASTGSPWAHALAAWPEQDADARSNTLRQWAEHAGNALASLASLAQQTNTPGRLVLPEILQRLVVDPRDDVAAAALAALARLDAAEDPPLVAARRQAFVDREAALRQWVAEIGGKVFDRSNHVGELVLNGRPIQDADLCRLRGLPQLTDLSLERTAITDAGLRHLLELPRLEWLNLFQTGVGDAGLSHLRRFPRLQHLPLGATRITDAGLAVLKDFPELRYLGLRANQISDEGLLHLAPLRRLTGLHLGETHVTDAGLRHLAGCGQLERLWLNDLAITDASVDLLTGWQRLQELHLRGTQVSAAAVQRLRDALPGCNLER